MAESTNSDEVLLPPKPTEPLDSECCGTGCTPCVFDIYKNQIKRWEKDCQEILINGRNSESDEKDSTTRFLTPEKYQHFTITEVIQETESIKIFSFTTEPYPFPLIRDEDFPIKLGQHVLIRQNNISKQFTILRLNIEKQTFDILIKIYTKGLITPLIDKIVVKDSMEMRGPFGRTFSYKANSMKYIVMLAAGTGIAPMYRIIEKLLSDDDDETRIKLVFATKSLAEIPLINKLKEWSSHWNFEVVYYLSSNGKEETKNTELPYYGMNFSTKRVDCVELKNQTKCCDTSKTLFLICGTKSFEKDMINNLQKLGESDLSSNTVVF